MFQQETLLIKSTICRCSTWNEYINGKQPQFYAEWNIRKPVSDYTHPAIIDSDWTWR